MIQIDFLFQSLVSLIVISTIVLGAGALITRQLCQPIEKVRCIQWTLLALVASLFLRQASLLPALSLEVFPAAETTSAIPPTTSGRPSAGSEVYSKIAADSTLAHALEANPYADSPRETKPEAELSATSSQAGHTVGATLKLVCLIVVAAGILYSLSLLLLGHLQLRNLLKTCLPANDALLTTWRLAAQANALRTRVVTSDAADVPLTFGFRQPVILLPTILSQSTDLRAVHYCLSHELGHVKSQDIRTWYALQWIQPIVWFQPLFWLLRRELRTAQDQLADDFALGRDDDRTGYAQLLVGLARRRLQTGSRLALTMSDRRSSLYRRIELLLTDKIRLNHVARRPVLLTTTACFAILAIGIGVLRFERASAAPVDDAIGDKSGSDTGSQQNTAANQGEEAVELSYSGEIIDEVTKQPIAGATVVVRRKILRSYERRVIEETKHTTDENGRYRFTIPPEQTAESAMYIELDIEHPDYAWKKGFGYALSMIRKNEQMGEKPFFAKVELSPAEALYGRVISPSNEPLADVIVGAFSRNPNDLREYGSFFYTHSDQRGRFRLQLTKGGPSVFWVVPQDYAPIQIVSGTKRGDWGDIPVTEGVEITGQVLSATGQPVGGVWVNSEDIAARDETSELNVSSFVSRSALTDSDGRFSLRPVQPGRHEMRVERYRSDLHRGGFFSVQDTPKPIDHVFVSRQLEISPRDATQPFTIQAVPHIEFHAQYVDSKGQPTRGHAVTIFGQFDGQWYLNNINPNPQGKVYGLLPHGLAEGQLQAITSEHSAIEVRLKKGGPVHSGQQILLGTIEDDLTGIELIRYKSPIVLLKPVDEHGNVVPDCKVSGIYADGPNKPMLGNGMEINTYFNHQENGLHRTVHMLPNRRLKFTATADGYQEATETLELPEGEERELVLVLRKLASNN